jgi:hypothetical protein
MAFGGVALEPAGLALGLASGSELGDEAGLLQLGEGACNLAVGDLHRVVGVGEVIARRGQRAHAEFDQGNDAEFLGNQIAGEAAGVLFTRVGLATFWRRRVANAPHGERHPVIVAQGCDLYVPSMRAQTAGSHLARISAGTLPPFSASFRMTCLCSHLFMGAVSFILPV